MKKHFHYGLLALIVGISTIPMMFGTGYARITGTNPTGASADIWCVGPSGAEVCVDSSGNVIPTTTNDTDLGPTSLVWNEVHMTAGGLTDASVLAADLASDAVTTAKIIVGAVTTTKLGDGAVTTQKILTDTVTTDKISFDTAEFTFGEVLCVTTAKKIGVCKAAPGTLCDCQ